MKKNLETRLEAIKQLLSEEAVTDQRLLVDLLKDKFKITTNQSVLSRDLRRLGVLKKEINNKLCYIIPTLDVNVELLKLAILDIKYNETTIVIKTFPGLADFVGDNIDQQEDMDILGCLAGENVVFIACKSIKSIQEIYHLICKKLHFKITQKNL